MQCTLQGLLTDRHVVLTVVAASSICASSVPQVAIMGPMLVLFYIVRVRFCFFQLASNWSTCLRNKTTEYTGGNMALHADTVIEYT